MTVEEVNENDELSIIFNQDNTYEIRTYLDEETSYKYNVRGGTYSIEGDTLFFSMEYLGSSATSFDDAYNNQTAYETYNGYYLYVDDYIYQANEGAVSHRQGSGSTLVGTWESLDSRSDRTYTYTTEFKSNNTVTQSVVRTILETGDQSSEGMIEGTYTDDNGILTIEATIEGDPMTITYPYRLVNNYNTLILNPCSRME